MAALTSSTVTLLVNDGVEVGQRAGRGRDALGGTDELAVELGQDQADGLGGAGGSWGRC